jgi:hypothetical protein
MRILTVVALLILAFTSASKAANDGPWCYRDLGGRGFGRRVRAQSRCDP